MPSSSDQTAVWPGGLRAAGLAGDLDVAERALSKAVQIHPANSAEWVEKYHGIDLENR